MECLSLQGSHQKLESLAPLGQLTKLTSLNIENFQLESYSGLPQMNLKRFSLKDCRIEDIDNLLWGAKVGAQLESLELINNSSAFKGDFLRSYTNLKKINFSINETLTGGKADSKESELYFSASYTTPSPLIEKIASYCSKLESLSLEGDRDDLADLGLTDLQRLNQCQNLQHLLIKGAHLSWASEPKFENLKEIRLEKCQFPQFPLWLKNSKKLENISLVLNVFDEIDHSEKKYEDLVADLENVSAIKIVDQQLSTIPKFEINKSCQIDLDECYCFSHTFAPKVHNDNILLIGRSRVGKTTAVKVLQGFAISDGIQPFLFSDTKQVKVRNVELGPNNSFHIVDAPGYFDRTTISDTEKKWLSNKRIFEMQLQAAEEIFSSPGFTGLDSLFFAFSSQAGLNIEDNRSLALFIKEAKRYGAKIHRKNAKVLITRTETTKSEQKKALIQELMESPFYKNLVGRGDVFFVGCVDSHSMSEHQENARLAMSQTLSYRSSLITYITGKLDIKFNTINQNLPIESTPVHLPGMIANSCDEINRKLKLHNRGYLKSVIIAGDSSSKQKFDTSQGSVDFNLIPARVEQIELQDLPLSIPEKIDCRPNLKLLKIKNCGDFSLSAQFLEKFTALEELFFESEQAENFDRNLIIETLKKLPKLKKYSVKVGDFFVFN
ncbi:MAG: leucine-rich repeat domain-containing protein [Verrucomicrobia bacterium]|nr:leucine-rich repeat domain-containing protein [Verrucomicrobiota bacterium]